MNDDAARTERLTQVLMVTNSRAYVRMAMLEKAWGIPRLALLENAYAQAEDARLPFYVVILSLWEDHRAGRPEPLWVAESRKAR